MKEAENNQILISELQELEEEHAELDGIIDSGASGLDEVTFQRIKKRKLFVKDKIIELKTQLYPDIIA